VKNNGLTIKTAAWVLIVVLGLIIFVLTQFNMRAGTCEAAVIELSKAGGDREARLRVLESTLADIRTDVREIKQTLAAKER